MNETDRWIHFDGPPPPAVERLLDALREDDAPGPSPEQEEHLMGALFGGFERWIARVREEHTADRRGSDVYPISLRAPAPEPAAPWADDGAAKVSFDVWASISCQLIGATLEEKEAAVAALGVTVEAWTRIEQMHLRALSDDQIAGRTWRPAMYRAMCHAEMDRRRREAAAEAANAVEEPAPLPTAGSAPTLRHLKSTADAVEMSPEEREAAGRLPFVPAAPAGAAKPKAAAKTMQARAVPGPGTTLPLDGDVIQKAVVAMPFSGGVGAVGIVSFRELTVRQYVSLRAALALEPERAAETLLKYGVPNEAARRALDEHWRAKVAASAEVRAERDAAVEELVGWLRGE